MKMRFLGPFFIFILLVGLLYKGLNHDPAGTQKVLLDRPSPIFEIGTVFEPQKRVTEALWQGKVSVLNVWASWCSVCEAEHTLWVDLAKTQDRSRWQLVGLNYHDPLENARHFLSIHGNPYGVNLFDEHGTLGMEYGVYATPETFVIDQKGVIRYRHPGGLTKPEWDRDVWPLIQQLSQKE